jgi:predicted RNase H-like nuclease (RuvC/YqgF family)
VLTTNAVKKLRLQSQDLAHTQDDATQQVESLKRELADSKHEVSTTVRQSVAEDKQSLESQLDEERRQKERARQALDNRMAELAKRKVKFAGTLLCCMARVVLYSSYGRVVMHTCLTLHDQKTAVRFLIVATRSS